MILTCDIVGNRFSCCGGLGTKPSGEGGRELVSLRKINDPLPVGYEDTMYYPATPEGMNPYQPCSQP